MSTPDPINRPAHYTAHPSGIEPITISRHLPSNLGQALQYVMRHRFKGEPARDLRKAAWFLRDEAALRASGSWRSLAIEAQDVMPQLTRVVQAEPAPMVAAALAMFMAALIAYADDAPLRTAAEWLEGVADELEREAANAVRSSVEALMAQDATRAGGDARLRVTSDMVTRFLGWRLPEDFAPDCGITFKPLVYGDAVLSWPSGTNLLTGHQAKAMLEHVLAAGAEANP